MKTDHRTHTVPSTAMYALAVWLVAFLVTTAAVWHVVQPMIPIEGWAWLLAPIVAAVAGAVVAQLTLIVGTIFVAVTS